jgi:hypothetical protein
VGARLSAGVLARCGAGRARLERYAARATALVRGLERPPRRRALRHLTAVLGRWYATIRGSRRCLGARGVEIESRAVGALLQRVTR